MKVDTDVIVIGGGLVGGSLAGALSQAGLTSIVVEAYAPDAQAQPSFDERTIALTYSARQVFSGLELWSALTATGEVWPIRDIEVSDRTDTGLCNLSHADVGLDALGYVVPTRIIGRVLHDGMQHDARIDLRCPANAVDVTRRDGIIVVTVESDGQASSLTARLVVLADGGRSTLGGRLGLSAEKRSYPQSALVSVVATDRAHDGQAYERFTGEGPLALLPVRDNDFAVAWTLPADRATQYLDFSDEQLCAELQSHFELRAGHFVSVSSRKVYPLGLTQIAQPEDGRVVAIGNAAHIVHPVAGQGFNLGLRDAVALADELVRARADGDDIGGPEVIGRYLRAREEETRRVAGFTDAMISVFNSKLLPLKKSRNAVLRIIDRLPAAKRELLWRTTGLRSSSARVVRRINADGSPSVAADKTFDVIVVGAGLIGGAMACALGDSDLRVALVDRVLPAPLPEPLDDYDLRINAYNRAAEQLLRDLDVWERLPAERVFPFRNMYVGNERGSGSVNFSALEIGETHLGHFIENRLVTRALIDRALELPNVDVLTNVEVSSVEFGRDRAVLTSSDAKSLQAKLLIGADGANSRVREAAGIGVRLRPYGQRCIVGTIGFAGDLDATAWQRFLYTGPLGLLPLAPGFCSLAWSCDADRAEHLLQLSDEQFAGELAQATAGRLGEILSIGQRAAFPLTAREAVQYAAARTALIGDAAHVIHPLAGLGANIGFMDVETLARLVMSAASRPGRDIGGERLLRRYGRQRRGENKLLMSTMTAFNALFSNDDSLLGTLRDGGLRFADQIAPAKKFLMRRAMWMDFSPLGSVDRDAPAHPAQTREQT